MNRLGEMIKTYREKNKLTQTQFAKKIGFTAMYICDIENGNKNLATIKTIDKIANAIGRNIYIVRAAAFYDFADKWKRKFRLSQED